MTRKRALYQAIVKNLTSSTQANNEIDEDPNSNWRDERCFNGLSNRVGLAIGSALDRLRNDGSDRSSNATTKRRKILAAVTDGGEDALGG